MQKNTWQIECAVPSPVRSIALEDTLLFLGSCFTQNIGNWFAQNKWNAPVDPFGILFHPLAIQKALSYGIEKHTISMSDIFENQGLYRHWDMHSQCAHPDKNIALAQMQSAVEHMSEAISGLDHLIITFGTAHIYTHLPSGKIVANNHKMPAPLFNKTLLTVDAITSAWKDVLNTLFALRPQLQVIFTVSPVRHIRDGVAENNLSKAILIQSVHHLCSAFDRAVYFPAYELQIDVLRDYRFYAEDMVHPSRQAVAFILDAFNATYLNEQSKQWVNAYAQILNAKAHQPVFPGSEAHKAFVSDMQNKIEQLQRDFPSRNLTEDSAYFQD